MMEWPTAAEVVGLLIAGVVALSLYRAHRDPAMSSFNLFDLLMEGGKVSKVSCAFMGSWTALTYVFVGMYFSDKMTDGLYMAYGTICFAPIIARMFATPTPTPTPTTTPTTEDPK